MFFSYGSGNVFVTGWSATLKYAVADGALLWEQRHSSGRMTAIAVDGSGNVVVTGVSLSKNTDNDYSDDYYTAKYAAADGALLWEKRYNGPANSYDRPNAVAVDRNGNVVVTGISWNGIDENGIDADYYTAKYAAADGALLWEQRYNGPANSFDLANAVTVDDSDNVVVTGNSDAVLGLAPIGGDYYTAKYAAADGVLLWERRYDRPANSFDFANAVTVDATGNVVVTGQIDVDGLGGGDYYTAKYAAADGVLLWEQRYDGSAPSHGSAREVAVDGNGNVAVTGITYNHSDSSVSEGDRYTAKYAADGAVLWEKRHGNGTAFALKVDTSGNVVVTDPSYTAKYAAADGALLWEKRGSSGWANAVDGSGNVVVTGTSYNGTNYGYYTAKYAAADGALLWEKFYNGPANLNDEARAVAVDASGNVLVTGHSAGSRTITGAVTYDYYTAKYAAADGALLWERRVNLSIGASASIYHAIAVDGDGHVVVTANNSHGLSYAAKYAAASGALLWERRDTRAGLYGTHALAVDSGGNVVVTGVGSTGGGVLAPRYHHYIARYAAADGALLWEKRNDGESRAVAVDRSGNVVVTGWSYDANSTPSSSTAKYAAADGALLWEKRFDGSVGPSSYGLALGPDGMVFVTGTSKDAYTTVAYRDVPAVSIDLISTGVRLRFTGIPGRSYNLERAPALPGPWSTINTQTAPASGPFEYLDTTPHPGSGFYRTVQP